MKKRISYVLIVLGLVAVCEDATAGIRDRIAVRRAANSNSCSSASANTASSCGSATTQASAQGCGSATPSTTLAPGLYQLTASGVLVPYVPSK